MRRVVLAVAIVVFTGTSLAQMRINSGTTILGGIDVATNAVVAFGLSTDVIYVGITFRDTLRVATGTVLRSRGGTDAAVIAYDASWTPRFVHHVGGAGMDSVVAIATMYDGGCAATFACCGETITPTTVRVGGITFSGRGGYDVVTAAWHEDGRLRWTRLDGGDRADLPSALCVTQDHSVIVTGTYVGNTRFGTHVVQDLAQTSAFITRIEPQGTVAWLQSTRSSNEHPTVPRGFAVGGNMVGVTNDAVIATVQAAGVVGFGSDSTLVFSYDFATLPHAMQCNLADGTPMRWNAQEGCRGDSVAATLIGATVMTSTIEPRSCIAGTEPVMALRVGATTLRYVPGGPNSSVRTAITRADQTTLLGGSFERTMLFDTLSRTPDLLALSFSLQDGWIAAFTPQGLLRSALSIGASGWGQVTSVAARNNSIAAAAVIRGTVATTTSTVGIANEVSVVVLRIDDPAMHVVHEEHHQQRALQSLWTINGRSVGADAGVLPVGVYVGYPFVGAPYLVYVGIMRP